MKLFNWLFGDNPYRRPPWMKLVARAVASYDMWAESPQATEVAEATETSLKLYQDATRLEARKTHLAEARQHLDELLAMMEEYPYHNNRVLADLVRRVELCEDELESAIRTSASGC